MKKYVILFIKTLLADHYLRILEQAREGGKHYGIM